jgi:predicted PhzF superfamily epimerase YddE/YHI9
VTTGPATLPLTVVDAFAEAPFTGNPAAVCVTPEPLPDGLMQRIALEMAHAETAFLVPRPDGAWSLRWFTPAVEVDLCGHATLAAAHVLWGRRLAPACMLTRFHTRSGVLTARGEDGVIWLDLTASPPRPVAPPPGLRAWLGTDPEFVGEGECGLAVVVPTADAVRALAADPAAITPLHRTGVVVTAPGDPGGPHHAVSRYFSPQRGVPEDPVTGSAHCVIGPYWAGRLGEPELRFRQLSPRGGEVRVRAEGARVGVGGAAVTTLEGELRLPSGGRYPPPAAP